MGDWDSPGTLAFVLDSPQGLSSTAQRFLRENACRVEFDRELTGEELRRDMLTVNGFVDEELLILLDRIQARYGGLSYPSGYFGNTVEFTPVCEPEMGEELHISYAVQSGTAAGAQLNRDGAVEVCFEDKGLLEFPSLDNVIEWDAAFAKAKSMRVFKTFYLPDSITFEEVNARLRRIAPDTMPISETWGHRSWWFAGPNFALGACRVWRDLELIMPPVAYIGADDAAILADALKELHGRS